MLVLGTEPVRGEESQGEEAWCTRALLCFPLLPWPLGASMQSLEPQCGAGGPGAKPGPEGPGQSPGAWVLNWVGLNAEPRRPWC